MFWCFNTSIAILYYILEDHLQSFDEDLWAYAMATNAECPPQFTTPEFV